MKQTLAIAGFLAALFVAPFVKADDAVSQVKAPTKGKRWTCSIQELSQGGGQVRFCRWEKK